MYKTPVNNGVSTTNLNWWTPDFWLPSTVGVISRFQSMDFWEKNIILDIRKSIPKWHIILEEWSMVHTPRNSPFVVPPLHKDIKPENFMWGVGSKQYLGSSIDFVQISKILGVRCLNPTKVWQTTAEKLSWLQSFVVSFQTLCLRYVFSVN